MKAKERITRKQKERAIAEAMYILRAADIKVVYTRLYGSEYETALVLDEDGEKDEQHKSSSD